MTARAPFFHILCSLPSWTSVHFCGCPRSFNSSKLFQVLNQRAALLSNYEVLTWLRELESEHLLRTKTALRVKKEEENLTATTSSGTVPSTFGTTPHLEASENLRTVEVEAGLRNWNICPLTMFISVLCIGY